ncbi:hypothetical protein GW626_00865 [Peribacillus muralis]|uniref:hypothetical protein n=1 Tax=Peribacillus muralis TaxID=264697 RepID=UPI001F4EE475|nr:hypothetical protein [Peribacillus muralis]MCK1995071.1 hypothetical protein [Peribacillus muralis]MCK2015703.1 hypothetical protein [Peribacillus muralis]
MKKLLYVFILIIPVLFGYNPTATFASSPAKEVDLKETSQLGEFPTESNIFTGTDVLLGQEIPILVDENTGEITNNRFVDISPMCATCNQYTWKTATDKRQSRVFHKKITESTKWSLNLTFKVEIAGKAVVSGGGEKIYSATKKWDQYKETWKLTGTLKTYSPTGKLIKTEQKNQTYIKYKKVATK